MTQPQIYWNGEFLPPDRAAIAWSDLGFMLGASVTEQLRTFRGELFHLEDHLRRLRRSLDIVGFEPPQSLDELASAARQLAETNYRLLPEGGELGLGIFVTPGLAPQWNDGQSGPVSLGMYTYPLPLATWAHKYEQGQALVRTGVEQVSAHCWPRELKCRSRMHYFLADREAAAKDPEARAVLQDAEGYVTEASTANLLLVCGDKELVVPPASDVLPGISQVALLEIARELGFRKTERRLQPSDVAQADEVLLSSTPFCLLPVSRFDGAPIGGGQPGPVYHRLIAAWSQQVGIDIIAQAKRMRARS